jgi:hypothetical protein
LTDEVELFNRELEPNLKLPPIKHPSMHPKEKPFSTPQEELLHEKLKKRAEKEIAKLGGKNAEANLSSLLKDYPSSREGINLIYVDTPIPDLLYKEKHMPQRTIKLD